MQTNVTNELSAANELRGQPCPRKGAGERCRVPPRAEVAPGSAGGAGKAAVNAPQSKRWRAQRTAFDFAKRLECGGFSTAFSFRPSNNLWNEQVKWFSHRIALFTAIGLWLLPTTSSEAQSRRSSSKTTPPAITEATAPTTFAPVAENHPLAGVWNDPGFVRQLLGSYGFLADHEPRLTPEEQQFYRDKIVPLLREDPKKAIPELEARIKPDASALFDFTLGNIHFQAENLPDAVKCFEQATLKFANFRRAWKNLGLALLRDGKQDEAIMPLARSIALGEVDGRTYGLLAFAHLSAGRFVAAEAAYRQALLFEPDILDFQTGLLKCLVGQANYDGALALLEELLHKHAERDALWAIQANVFLQKNQPAKAAVNFEVLRRLGKITPEQLGTLGDIYMMEEARDLALTAYQESIEQDGWQRPARALRTADILVSRGAWDEAKSVFEKVREVSAGKLEAADEMKLMKLEAKVAMSTGAGETAILVLEKITGRNPLDGEALILAGDYFARIGELEKAEFRYDAAAKLSGFEADALVKQAQLLIKSAKYTQALEALKQAQKLKPRDHVQRFLDRVEQIALARRS
ncbi:MAG: tetratricopeptide repeat protein [Verrucomicrobiae bacterium]|nr:tetratricopeptide repeat protein [Verrucomicrobiae bacterium]